ncbi:hypothetical protein BH10ACT11_BH10ACT11_15790 [soil metagenome]
MIVVVAALLGGCGGGDDSTTAPATGASGASGASGSTSTTSSDTSTTSDETTTEADTDSSASAGALSADDESQISDTAKTWLTEGGCDLMTDAFLKDQTFEDDRDIACKTFESLFKPPSFDADQITVTKIDGDSMSASATIGDTLGSGVESTYKFKKVDGNWQIDKASL